MAIALTLDNICPRDLVRALPGVSSTWDDDNIRAMAIARVCAYLNIPCQICTDTDNPFLEAEHTETIDGTGDEWLYLRYYPVVKIETIKQDNTSISFTAGKRQASNVDTWIMDDPENGTYYGCIRKANHAIWIPGDGNYEVTYRAGFDVNNTTSYNNEFPMGLKMIIADVAGWIINHPQGITGVKVGEVSYSYAGSVITDAGPIPKYSTQALNKYRRRPVV